MNLVPLKFPPGVVRAGPMAWCGGVGGTPTSCAGAAALQAGAAAAMRGVDGAGMRALHRAGMIARNSIVKEITNPSPPFAPLSPRTMRASPTFTPTNTSGANFSSFSMLGGPGYYQIGYAATATGACSWAGTYTASADL
jgi:hypothetical protein